MESQIVLRCRTSLCDTLTTALLLRSSWSGHWRRKKERESFIGFLFLEAAILMNDKVFFKTWPFHGGRKSRFTIATQATLQNWSVHSLSLLQRPVSTCCPLEIFQDSFPFAIGFKFVCCLISLLCKINPCYRKTKSNSCDWYGETEIDTAAMLT